MNETTEGNLGNFIKTDTAPLHLNSYSPLPFRHTLGLRALPIRKTLNDVFPEPHDLSQFTQYPIRCQPEPPFHNFDLVLHPVSRFILEEKHQLS